MARFLATTDPLPQTADVIVIGGGPAGAAALWAIERLSPGTKTILIEKSERLGAGSSLASLENFRTCWPAICLARQMARSVEVLLNADEYLGEGASQAVAAKKRGYLFCAFNTAQAKTFQSDVKRLHDIGLTHIEYLDAAEVAYRFGWVGNRVIAAKFDPIAGWVDSNALIYQYVRSAASAQIVLDAGDVSICVENGRVTGIRTLHGDISAPNVVIAAGASARAVGRTAGIELPIVVRPRQSFTTGWRHEAFPEDAPMIIGAAPFPHVRPEARTGAIFGWEYNWRVKGIGAANEAGDALIDPIYPADKLKDPRFPSVALMLLAKQFGSAFDDPRYMRGISHNAGYYVSRDESVAYHTDADGHHHAYESERAIIDRHPQVEGLFVSVAHVGHGIMTSPAAGEILASKVLGHPLPHLSFSDFGFDAHWVEYDAAVL